MNNAEAIMWAREGLFFLASVSGPVLLTALFIGVVVSVLQAVTQINEMTLVFVPKIAGVFLVMMLMGSWMLEVAVAFGTRAFESVAETSE